MTCSFLFLHSFSTSFGFISTHLFLLLLLVLTLSSINHVWAKDEKKDCQIDTIAMKYGGEFRPVLREQPGTRIYITVKGFKGTFTIQTPGTQTWTAIEDQEMHLLEQQREFLWVVCQHRNGSSSGDYDHSNISFFHNKAKQSQVEHLWKTCAPYDEVRNDSHFLLCPLKVKDEVCLFWGSYENNTHHLTKYTNEENALGSCVEWLTSCVFEDMAGLWAERHCLGDGSTKSYCREQGRSGRHSRTLGSVQSSLLRCSDLVPFWKPYENYLTTLPWNISTFTLPPCTPNLAKFHGDCKLKYIRGSMIAEVRMEGGCKKGWKLELSDEIKRIGARLVQCTFRTIKDNKQAASLQYAIPPSDIKQQTTTATTTLSQSMTSGYGGSSTEEPEVECGVEMLSMRGIVVMVCVGFGVVLVMAIIGAVVFYLRREAKEKRKRQRALLSGSDRDDSDSESSRGCYKKFRRKVYKSEIDLDEVSETESEKMIKQKREKREPVWWD